MHSKRKLICIELGKLYLAKFLQIREIYLLSVCIAIMQEFER